EQRSRLAQIRADRAVGRVELGVDDAPLPPEPQPVGPVEAARIDREDRIDAVGAAQLEIILAMVGHHVDEARALVGGDEVAGEEWPRPGEEPAELVHRVASDRAGEFGAFVDSYFCRATSGCASAAFICSCAKRKCVTEVLGD